MLIEIQENDAVIAFLPQGRHENDGFALFDMLDAAFPYETSKHAQFNISCWGGYENAVTFRK